MAWDERLEKLRLLATTLAAVYPAFAGLYIFGFFLNAPVDLIGAFSFTDFLFKSAVTFFCLAAVCVAYVAFLSVYAILVIEKVSGPFLESEPKRREDQKHWQWKDLGRGKITAIALMNTALLIVGIGVFVFFRERSGLPSLPNFLVGALMIVPAFSYVIALSLDKTRWLALRILYWIIVGLIVPIWFGYNDFELSAKPVEVEYASRTCAVRFIGGEKALIRCGDDDVLVDVGELEIRFPVS